MIHIRVSQLLAQCTVQNMYTKQHVEIRLKFLRVFYWHLNNWLGGGGYKKSFQRNQDPSVYKFDAFQIMINAFCHF